LRRGSDPDPALVRTFGLQLGRGTIAPPRVEPWHQFVTASYGRATVQTAAAAFPLMAGTGVWIPAQVPYTIALAGLAELRLLYVRPDATSRSAAVQLQITPLLAELIARTIGLGALDGRIATHRRLAAVVADELAGLLEARLALPLPPGGLARDAALALIDDDARALGIDGVAALCGVSRRTLERAFAREMGMGIAIWLRRLRFIDALRALRSGASVTAAALDGGYTAPSAFIAAFKREFSTTPRAYFRSAASGIGAGL
jgi:AraC-like DNA-binding protein